MSETPYRIPAGVHRTSITVVNSRFITTIAPAPSVDAAKSFLAQIRAEMPDATHHVHAFRVGYGNSVIEGMSDDGEPSGTSAPPTLAVLRGADIGDCIVVTTRYFGGTKLGTGGLVRAYSESARTALETLPTNLKIAKQILGIEVPYSLFEQIERLIEAYDGIIEDKTFEADVTLCVIFPISQIADFTAALSELSAGRIAPIILDDI